MSSYIVTEFSNIKNVAPTGHRELIEILSDIKSDKYEKLISACRLAADKSSLDAAKLKLPVFTPTGIFNRRAIAGMEIYNGFICLDIDHVENPEDLKKRAAKLDYVYAAFITASYHGLKVLIKTHATVDTYKDIELQVANAFFRDAGAQRDTRCRDISRGQYVSHDPALYLNEDSRVF